jgi:glycosyltransferase involved in cell wall biosynthesis
LAASRWCERVWIVSDFPLPALPGVYAIRPPAWLAAGIGEAPARLLTFAWAAWRHRPHVIGGFHLLINGLAGEVLARLVGARCLYFCVGGPMEVIDGGIWAENRLFGRLETPDAVIERRLVRAAGACDDVITMGTRAVRFFRRNRTQARFHVVPGGIDEVRFRPGDGPAEYDLILVGRLAAIKRIDLFLRVVAEVARAVPAVQAVVVGDGELRGGLNKQLHELGLSDRVVLAGHRADVESWLRRARVFVLTSQSEGLALSLMEAMSCGLPAVVSDVGDLADLVEDGVNGHLVPRDAPAAAFAAPIIALLTDPARYESFRRAARASAGRFTVEAMRRAWDAILAPPGTPAAGWRNETIIAPAGTVTDDGSRSQG